MLAQYLDLTSQFNTGQSALFETSNYDYAIVQIIGNNEGDNIAFNATLDSGAIQGVTDGNISLSNNYLPIVAENLASGLFVQTDGGSGGIFRFDVVGRYISISNNGDQSVNKLLIMLAKIS